MIMGIDHGYYAIKTRHFSFPAGVTAYTEDAEDEENAGIAEQPETGEEPEEVTEPQEEQETTD